MAVSFYHMLLLKISLIRSDSAYVLHIRKSLALEKTHCSRASGSGKAVDEEFRAFVPGQFCLFQPREREILRAGNMIAFA